MAKRKGARRSTSTRARRKTAGARRSGKRRIAARRAKRPSSRKKIARQKQSTSALKAAKKATRKVPHLERARRTLDDTVQTPPSSLDMVRRGTAARSGRKEMQDNLQKHGAMNPGLTAGDVDADWENAYFSGEEAPGGDNPTPDQDLVDDIGKALGVEYQDNEELKASDKVVERDKHRWELDPASAEDYKDRR